MHKSCSHASHEQKGDGREFWAKVAGKTRSKHERLGAHSGGRPDNGCVTRWVRYVSAGVVKRVALKVAVLRLHKLEGILKEQLGREMAVSQRLANVAEAKQPGSKGPTKPVDASPIPVSVSPARPGKSVPCKAGSACKRLLRKNVESDRLRAVRIDANKDNYDDVSDVPLEEYCDDSFDCSRGKFDSGVSEPRLPRCKRRRRTVRLQDLDDASGTPLEQYDDNVPENRAWRLPPLSNVTHRKAAPRRLAVAQKAVRPIHQPKVTSSAGQGEQLKQCRQRSLIKDEKKSTLEPSMSARPETANTEHAKHTCNAAVGLLSCGTRVCPVTTVKPNNKSSLALAADKEVIEKKAPKRLGTPCKNEDAKKVKSGSGTVKSMIESSVGKGKKSSSQSPTVKVSANKLVRGVVSHTRNNPKMRAATPDNHCATQEAPGRKLKAGATAAKVRAPDVCRTRAESSSSATRKELPCKLAKKPESPARGSSDLHLPATTQKTSNGRPETKKAGSATDNHNVMGSSTARNILPNTLAQEPESCTMSSSASSQSNSTRAVPSSTSKTSKDAAQSKASCIPSTTRQSTSFPVTRMVLPKIPKKPMFSDMSAKSGGSTLKKEALAKGPISTFKNVAETKVSHSSGTDLQTIGPLVPSLDKMVSTQVSCAESSDLSPSKPPSPVSIPKMPLTFTSKADKGAVPSVPAKKSAPCVNSSASNMFSPEKIANVNRTIQSDLKAEHKRSDGHPGTLGKERVVDNAANHGSKTDCSQLYEATTGKQSNSVATVQVKISRSKLASCPDILIRPSVLVNSADSLKLEESKQQLLKLPKSMPSVEQTDHPVRSFPDFNTPLPKARNVNLPHCGHQASIESETTLQAEATVTAASEGSHGTTATPTDGTGCLEQKAQASEQPAKYIADSVSGTVLSSYGLHTHKKTGTSQDLCTSKMQEPMTEVRELIADVLVQVASNLTDLADIGAEVECSDGCVSENNATVHQGDQVRLTQDLSNVTDRFATSAVSNAVGMSGPELLMDATEHKIENALELADKDATTVPCKLDMESIGTAAPTLEQANGPLIEGEQYSISLANHLASEMLPTTGDCDRASNLLPKNCCLQHLTGKGPGATHNDSTQTPDQYSHNEPLSRTSSQGPGGEVTAVAREICDSESVAVCEGIREETTAVSEELVASEVATETMRTSDASMCAINGNSWQESENVNSGLEEIYTDNAALSTAEKFVGSEVPEEKKDDDGTNACAADESSEQQAEAEEPSASVSQNAESENTVEGMDIDNSMHNESSSIHSQVDESISLSKELEESSGTLRDSSNGMCDEGSSTETYDSVSLLSEDSVGDASQPVAIAGAPKPSRQLKKRKRNRSAGTNTSLCSEWVFSRNRRGKQKHRGRQHSGSSGENSSKTSNLASFSSEGAANTTTVADVPAQDIHKLEAVPQVKEEPPKVNACGDTLVSSDARKPLCTRTVHKGGATKDPETAAYKKPLAPIPAAPHAEIGSFVHGALLDLDMFTGLSILDICGSQSTTRLKDLKARIMNHTITKNDAVAEIARSVRNAVVEEYFKGERAVKTLQLLSKIPFSLEPTKVHKIRKLTQAILGKSDSFAKLQL